MREEAGIKNVRLQSVGCKNNNITTSYEFTLTIYNTILTA